MSYVLEQLGPAKVEELVVFRPSPPSRSHWFDVIRPCPTPSYAVRCTSWPVLTHWIAETRPGYRTARRSCRNLSESPHFRGLAHHSTHTGEPKWQPPEWQSF